MSKAFDDWFSKRYPTTQDTLNPPQITNLVTLLTEAWQAGAQAAHAAKDSILNAKCAEIEALTKPLCMCFAGCDDCENQPSQESIAEALRARLALPDAEPVAWTLTETLDKRETTTTGYLWFKNPVNACWSPLYATPQPAQVERKPLTDEQILNLARDHYNPHQRSEISFARAIEQAHNIKE